MVVLNAEPFYPPYNVQFRREFSHQVEIDWNNTIVSDELSEYHRQNPEGPIYDRCSSSEINVLCRDFHRHGFDRVLIVSKAKVAYEFEAYHDLKAQYPGQMERWDPREDEILLFRPPPEAVECRPMDGTVQRDPNGPAGLELFDDDDVVDDQQQQQQQQLKQ